MPDANICNCYMGIWHGISSVLGYEMRVIVSHFTPLLTLLLVGKPLLTMLGRIKTKYGI